MLRAAPAYLLRSDAPGALGFRGDPAPFPVRASPCDQPAMASLMHNTVRGRAKATFGIALRGRTHERHHRKAVTPVDRGNDLRATWWDKLCYCCSCSAIAHPSSFPTSATPPRPAPRSPRPPNTGGSTGGYGRSRRPWSSGGFASQRVRSCGVGTKIRAAFLPRYVFLHGVHPVFLHGYPTPCFYTGSYPCFYTGRGSLGHRASVPHPRTGVFERSLGARSHGYTAAGPLVPSMPCRPALHATCWQ